MERKWHVIYYETRAGSCSIQDFVDSRKDRDQARVLYYFCFGDFIILTHAFVKTTNNVPRAEITKALKCRADFLSRYNEKKLKEELNENL